MTEKSSLILCSTVHDPKFRLKSIYYETRHRIQDLFSKRVIVATEATSNQLKEALENDNYDIIVNGSSMVVDTYTAAINRIVKYIDRDYAQSIFYIDFDRLIHWIKFYPEEINNILEKNYQGYEYIHFGRNYRAFESHPNTQKETEHTINTMVSKILGLKKSYDFMSVCYILSKNLANIVLKLKNSTSTGFYGVWPMIFWLSASNKKYIEVDGLEWETPDRFIEEIENLGNELWLERFQSEKEWKKRMTFINDFINEVFTIVKFNIKDSIS